MLLSSGSHDRSNLIEQLPLIKGRDNDDYTDVNGWFYLILQLGF